MMHNMKTSMSYNDTVLWLYNKFGSGSDYWTNGSICSMLNSDILKNIKYCFPDLQSKVKLQLLASFFYLPRSNMEKWAIELKEILELANVDSDTWVSMLAGCMNTFTTTGMINTEINNVDKSKKIISEFVNDLQKSVEQNYNPNIIPLEWCYLNNSVLTDLGQQPNLPTKHFLLKKEPKSQALKTDLLQRSTPEKTNMKRKQIYPERSVKTIIEPKSISLVSSDKYRPTNNYLKFPTSQKGSIKLLNFHEQPLTKKKKKLQKLKDSKKSVSVPIPDYAASLQNSYNFLMDAFKSPFQ